MIADSMDFMGQIADVLMFTCLLAVSMFTISSELGRHTDTIKTLEPSSLANCLHLLVS